MVGDTVTIPGRPEPLRVDLVTGDLVDRYVLIERLGVGGMGVVWAARDPELDRKVAIKLVHRTVVHERAQERLLREAQAMARLSHPAVVPIFDVRRTDGQWFVAMELVDGSTLRTALRERRLRWDEVLAMFVRAGRGLAASHDAGIIHRDFKPENVLVGRDGRVRVTDFGLASFGLVTDEERDSEDVEASDGRLTSTGAIMGTPKYMAPEQHAGGEVTAASDQFSFSVALWEALYGRLPFEPIDEATSRDSYAARVIAGELCQPPAEAAKAVPHWLHEIVTRGLEVDPLARWPSMTAMLDTIERIPRQRRRIAVGIVGGSAVAAIAGLIMFAIARGGAAGPSCPTFEGRLVGVWDPQVRERGARAFGATALPFAAASWERVATRLDAYAAEWLDRARDNCVATVVRQAQPEAARSLRERCLEGRLDSFRALTTTLGTADAKGVRRAIDAANALPQITICDDVAMLAEQPLPPTDEEQRRKADEFGRSLALIEAQTKLGSYAAAVEQARSVAKEAATLGYAPREARAQFVLGYLETELGNKAGAENLARASELADVARDDRLRIEALNALGMVQVAWGQLAEARSTLRQEHAVIRRLGSPPRAEVWVRTTEVELAWTEEDYPTSISIRREAIAWAEKVVPRDDVLIGRLRLNLAQVLERTREYDEAEKQLALGRVELEQGLSPDHPQIAGIYNIEGGLRLAREDLAGAADAFERAVKHYQRTLGTANVDILAPMSNQGLIYLELERYAEAQKVFTGALAVAEKVYPPDHADVIELVIANGEAALALKDLSKVLAFSDRAYALLAKTPQPTLLARTNFLVGQALWLQGTDKPRAQKLLHEARTYFAAAGPAQVNATAAIDKWLTAQHVPER